MLPSDHYVKCYNELFKMLEEKGHRHLQNYWKEISKLQTKVVKPYAKKGLKGLYDYWDKIRFEENCKLKLTLTKDYLELKMKRCPSLSKALDNDAGVFKYYCDHCAGWVEPALKRYGFYYVLDIVDRSKPVCHGRVYKDKKKAEEYKKTVKLLSIPYK